MFDYIDKLRKKSDTEKRRFAIIFSSVIVIIVALFWFVAISIKVKNGDFFKGADGANGGANIGTEVASDTPSLKDTWKDFLGQINNIVNNNF